MLAAAIKANKTIVLEINGDKNFSWLFVNKPNEDSNDYFKNKHRKILKTKYKIEICYLSHPYTSLLKANSSRFLRDIKACTETACSARLGNSLLTDKYKETVSNILSTYEFLANSNFFIDNGIDVSFWHRTSDNTYTKLASFENYKRSFESLLVPSIPATLHTQRPLSLVPSIPHSLLTRTPLSRFVTRPPSSILPQTLLSRFVTRPLASILPQRPLSSFVTRAPSPSLGARSLGWRGQRRSQRIRFIDIQPNGNRHTGGRKSKKQKAKNIKN
jgi:hypothetical protein